MSNEFKPGHPVLFWTFIIVMCFVMGSLIRAAQTADDCPNGPKQWVVTDFNWACGDDGIALTN